MPAGPLADAAANSSASDAQSEAALRSRALRVTPILLFPVSIAAFVLTFVSVDLMTPAIPAVRDALRLSGTTAGMVVSLYFIGRLVMSLPAGMLVDRIGARWTMALGAAVMIAGSALCAVADNAPVLLAGRFIQGVALAMLLASIMLSIVRARPGDGAAVMIMNVSSGTGSAVGLIASGALIGAFDWPGVFLGGGALALGMLVLALAFPATAGYSRHPANQLDPTIVDQSRVPLLKLMTPMALNLLVQGAYGVFMVALPLYAAWRFDASSSRIGALLITNMVTHVAMAIVTGWLIRRYRAARIIPFGLAVAVIGLIGILTVPRDLLLIPFLACWAGGMVAANMSAADLLLDRGGRGPRAVTLSRLTTDIAQVVGPAVVGVVVDLVGYPAPLAMLAALLVGGGGLAVREAFRGWPRVALA